MTIDTGHFELIAPGQEAWTQVKRVILVKLSPWAV